MLPWTLSIESTMSICVNGTKKICYFLTYINHPNRKVALNSASFSSLHVASCFLKDSIHHYLAPMGYFRFPESLFNREIINVADQAKTSLTLYALQSMRRAT